MPPSTIHVIDFVSSLDTCIALATPIGASLNHHFSYPQSKIEIQTLIKQDQHSEINKFAQTAHVTCTCCPKNSRAHFSLNSCELEICKFKHKLVIRMNTCSTKIYKKKKRKKNVLGGGVVSPSSSSSFKRSSAMRHSAYRKKILYLLPRYSSEDN